MTDLIASGVTFSPTDFNNYGWLDSITVNGSSYIRILGLFAAGIGEMQAKNGSFLWLYSTTTAMADPGTGTLRLNNATVSSVTAIAMSALTDDSGNPNVLTFLKTWDDLGATANRGSLIMRKSGAPATFAAFTLTGSVTDNTTWVQLAVTYVTGSGSLSASDILTFQFIPTGATGAYTSSLELQAIASLSSASGAFPAFTGSGTAALRTMTGTANQITVTNGSGVSGNPTWTIPSTFIAPGTIAATTTVADSVGNLRSVQQSGSDKTSNYVLLITDIGQTVGIGTGGSVEIPNATFAAGNVICVFNNTTAAKTITGTITTMYQSGIDTDKATLSLATRGMASIYFISGTVCIVSGPVS